MNMILPGCESAEKWQLPSTSTIAVVIIMAIIPLHGPYRTRQSQRSAAPVSRKTPRESVRVRSGPCSGI